MRSEHMKETTPIDKVSVNFSEVIDKVNLNCSEVMGKVNGKCSDETGTLKKNISKSNQNS